MNQNLPTLYTLKECCSILKVGRNKMLELIWNGEIDAFKIGGHWKISEDAIKEYIFHHT
jgi:excisionase family DNA binding protein